MKVAIALHACMDLGGIINHTEQLIGGLKQLGHEVRLFELVYADRALAKKMDADLEKGPSRIPFHQGKGWRFERCDRLAYKKRADMLAAKQVLNEFDVVVWTVPVVPKNKTHIGNDLWPELYALKPETKQVAFIHDGNCPQNYPHIYHIREHLTGLACVHGCAYNGAAKVPVPRALILNPQENPVRATPHWNDRQPGFINMQTFKAWKHVHELVEAIAYMPKRKDGELREIAGKGIEYQYMTSIDKCKDAYYHQDGRKFWDAAEDNGLRHHDYWSTEDVRNFGQMARALVDPSWSKKYSKIGGHWNRVVVDAMIHGCIPIAQKRGMGSELFQPWVHYVPLPETHDPQEYADTVLSVGNFTRQQAAPYIEAAREILPSFDRVTVAQQVIDLAHGNIETETGTLDNAVYQKYDDLMFDHYGVLV